MKVNKRTIKERKINNKRARERETHRWQKMSMTV